MSDQHLSRETLTAWRDHGTGDRVAFVGHLASCAACRGLAAEVERGRPPEAESVRFDPADFVARGYRAGVAPGPRLGAGRWRWFAAAAALLALAIVPRWLPRADDAPPTMRGETTALVPVRPVGVTIAAEDVTFEWRGAPGASVRLGVIDLDRPDSPLIDREVVGTAYRPTPQERGRFLPGQTVHWFVEARGAPAGGTSPAARFRIR